jgi:hypothetical protein
MSEPQTLETFEVMPVDVYQGACRHIVLCQEWGTLNEESYLRIMLNERDAEKLATQILAVAREIRGK